MFNYIKKKFTSIMQNISGKGRITEQDIQHTLKEIKKTLLGSDVSLLVINTLIDKIKKSIVGHNINNYLTPGQEFIKILKQELINIMSSKNNKLNLSNNFNVILIVGLQGSGKTTSINKLSNYIKKTHKKKILVCSTDIYRPAAIEQLHILAKQSNIDFFQSHKINDPIKISKQAMKQSKKKLYDVLILDTSGRLHNNITMMKQIKKIQEITKPIETLFVIDSMMGQDTINIANQFNKILNISGMILTKLDSDTKGGAALSASYITKKPIKFIGTGEKIESFELFKPTNIANRILNMKNDLSIINAIEKNINKKKINKFTNQIQKKIFTMNEFKIHLQQTNKVHNMSQIISNLSNKNYNNIHNENIHWLKKTEAMINSMTIQERIKPKIIKQSRKKRIAKGSGTKIHDINNLLKQFKQVKQMIKKINNKGIKKTFNQLKNMIPNIF